MSDREDTRYYIPRENRGFALIFVNEKFKKRTKQEPRRGAEIDSEHLIECFTKLNFNILPVKNQTADDTLKLLRKFASGKERRKEHAAVFAFSTHGDQAVFVEGELASDVIYCTDGPLKISLITDILAESEGLQGKPKLFFFQACRGVNYDVTMKKEGEDVTRMTQDLSGMGFEETSSTVEVPLKMDMLISFSTPPGYLSLRSVTKGSFFITALHDTIMKHGQEVDLLTLMTLVNKRSLDQEFMVGKGQGEPWEINMKCIPWMASMLLKEVWF